MPKTVKKLTREEYQEPDEVKKPEPEVELETDPIEELKLCRSSIIYIFRVDTVTKQRRKVGQCAPEGFCWEFIERFGPGDYYIAARRGGEYVASKTVFIDPPMNPHAVVPTEIQSRPGTFPIAPDRDTFMTEMAGMVRDVMTQAMQGVQKQALPDDYFKSVAAAFQNGMEMAKAMIPKPQEPDRMFDILDRVLEIKDRLGDDSGDWQSRIFRMVEPFVGSMIEKTALREQRKSHPPTRTGAEQRRDAIPNRSVNPPPKRESAEDPKPETSQANGQHHVENRESGVKGESAAGPPTLKEFVYQYTFFLSQRTGETDPELRAEMFLEDLPHELSADLERVISQENSFAILKQFCPHIEGNLDWFKEWHDVVREIVLQTGDEDDDEPDVKAPEGTA